MYIYIYYIYKIEKKNKLYHSYVTVPINWVDGFIKWISVSHGDCVYENTHFDKQAQQPDYSNTRST